MAEERTDRTDYLGLLALMVAAADTDGWAYPYWNMMQLDAALNGLANAARTGVVPLGPPAVAPDLSLETSGGSLPGGQTIEVVQTFVDEWGRETAAGTQGSISTGDAIADPAVAPALGTPSSEASGYGGGTLLVVFTWVDGTGGETLPSPAATVQLPYLAAGLYSQLEVTLPSTPAAADAVQAWVYVQHRGGNVVLAKKITDPDTDTVTLDGTTADCYLTPPYTNTTGSTRAIEITGETDPAAEKTRFYVRQSGEEWTTGDHRLTVGGADEWDIATVSYPLVYTGTNLTAGWPPTVSQVKAIRPIDLETETVGTLDDSQLPDVLVREQELVRSLGESLMSGCEVTAHAPADLGVAVGVGEVLLWSGRIVYETSTDLVIPLADPGNPRIDIICIADDGTLEGPTENAALKGSPASEPAVPTTPVGYIKLAEVSVGTGVTEIGTGDITDTRWMTETLVDTILEFRGWQDTHESDELLHFVGSEKADRLLTAQQLTDLTDGGNTSLHTHSGLGSSGHPVAVTNLLHTILWIEDMVPVIRETLDARPQMWRELLAVATMVADMEAILAGSSRRTFTDEERACAGSATVDFTIDVIDEGLLVQVDLTIEGEDPDIDFSVYRDAGRDVLVKTWANITETSTHRELLDWLNEEDPQSGSAYCRVVNNTANEVTVTTVLTIKEA